MALDPVTVVRRWLAVRPIRRIKEFRQRRKAAKGENVDETKLTIIRTVLKFAGGALVAKGFLDPADVPVLQTAIEATIGGLLTIAGVWWSHRTHSAAPEA
jgi:hypothetical protein